MFSQRWIFRAAGFQKAFSLAHFIAGLQSPVNLTSLITDT